MEGRLNPLLAHRTLGPLGPRVQCLEPVFHEPRAWPSKLRSLTSRFGRESRIELPSEWRSFKLVACGGNHGRKFFLDAYASLRFLGPPVDPLLFGPISFATAQSAELVRRCLGAVSTFAVREPATADNLRGLGLSNFEIVPDIAFLGFESDPPNHLANGTIGLCLRGRTASAKFVRGFISASGGLGLRTVILSTHAAQDAPMLDDLVAQRTAADFLLPESPDQYMDAVRGMDFIVSARLHGIIMAANRGCLAVPLCDTPKLRDQARFMDCPVTIAGDEDEPELRARLEEIVGARASLRESQRAWFSKASDAVRGYLQGRIAASS